MSPLMRGRGLKHVFEGGNVVYDGSPLMRGRGLKLKLRYFTFQIINVAPHAGAWIETKLA